MSAEPSELVADLAAVLRCEPTDAGVRAAVGRLVAAQKRNTAGPKKGGLATARRGPAFFAEIGRKGGLATARRQGKEHFARLGQQTGRASAEKLGKEGLAERLPKPSRKEGP